MASGGENRFGLLSDRHIVLAFLIGLAFILGGFAVETWLPSLLKALAQGWHLLMGTPTVEPTTHLTEEHGLGPVSLLTLLLKELGVAFMVAAIIGVVLEKQAKERDNERAMKLRADVANDAVFALYGLRHRREFIKAVVETNLEQQVVREGMNLDYRLRALTEAEATTILPHRAADALQRFVILEMTSRYSFRNVSSTDQDVRVRYVVPLRHGSGTRAIAGAHFVRIGEETLDTDRIAQAVQHGHDDLEYAWTRRLGPDRTLPVIISVRCVKELSDNEVWGSFYPTVDGVTLSLSVLDGMRFGVRPLSSASLVEQPGVPSSTSRTWRLDGPLLKHNSAVFWWRTREDDGEEVTSEPISFTSSSTAQSANPDLSAMNGRHEWKKFVPAWVAKLVQQGRDT